MSTSTEKKPLTAAQHLAAIRRTHNAANRSLHTVGLAVFAAEKGGMLTFDRPEKGKPIPVGVMTRKSLAEALGCSPTLVSKYRSLGRLDGHGIKPGHADYTYCTQQAAAAWMTEALDSGDTATVVRAIADHRKGSQSGQGGATAGKTKGSAKKAAPAADKAAPAATVTKASLEADVTRVVRWITANKGKRLDGMTADALAVIRANLADAVDAVDAALVRKGISPASADAAVAAQVAV